ncbi:MAG: hypothetical protein AVDCRST_MAG55-1989, partial [uncultured Rubrobacteraceae bacterium]
GRAQDTGDARRSLQAAGFGGLFAGEGLLPGAGLPAPARGVPFARHPDGDLRPPPRAPERPGILSRDVLPGGHGDLGAALREPRGPRRPARGPPLRHTPRHPRLLEAARLAALWRRRVVPAQLPGAPEDGQAPGRGVLPLAGHRPRGGRGVPAGRGERAGVGLPDQGAARLRGREDRHTDKGPAGWHDPDPAHLLRCALRLRLGGEDLGPGEYHLLRCFGIDRGRRPDVDLGHFYRYLYPGDKQV